MPKKVMASSRTQKSGFWSSLTRSRSATDRLVNLRVKATVEREGKWRFNLESSDQSPFARTRTGEDSILKGMSHYPLFLERDGRRRSISDPQELGMAAGDGDEVPANLIRSSTAEASSSDTTGKGTLSRWFGRKHN